MSDFNAKGNGSDVKIPELKKKDEKERKGAGVVAGSGSSSGAGGGFLYRWFGIGARPAASSLPGLRAAVGIGRGAAAAKMGFVPNLINFLTSNVGLALATAAVTGGAVWALYSLGMSTQGAREHKQALFAKAEAPAETSAAGPAPVKGDDSLGFFMTANQGGAFGQKDAVSEGEEYEEADEEIPEEEGVEEGSGVEEGQGTDLADELAKKLPKPKMVPNKGFQSSVQPLGSGVGLAGGPGMAGGMMRKFEKPRTQSLNTLAAPRRTRVSRQTRPISRFKGRGAMNQLKFTNKKSRKALGRTSSEGQSFDAAEAFTTAPPGAGGSIEGSGLGSGGAGIEPGIGGDGGPIDSSYTGEEPAPGTGESGDKSPWTQMVMLAMALLMTASTIITVIGILALLKNLPFIGPIMGAIQMMLFGVAAAMAATSAALGVMIMTKYGQMGQGAILTAGGSITTAVAVASMAAPQQMPSWAVVLGGIAGMASAIGSLLANSMVGPSHSGSSTSSK